MNLIQELEVMMREKMPDKPSKDALDWAIQKLKDFDKCKVRLKNLANGSAAQGKSELSNMYLTVLDELERI